MLWILPLIGLSVLPSDELKNILSEINTTAPDRPIPPSFGEPSVGPYFLADVKSLAIDKKEKIAAQLTRLLPLLAKEQALQSNGRDSQKLGILILQEIGTDKQKIEAFQELDLFNNSLYDACIGLATCEGPEGVRILKQYAEKQIPDFEREIERQKKNPGPVENTGEILASGKFGLALLALQGAINSEGPRAAAVLRDKYISISGDLLTEADHKRLEKELDAASKRRDKFIQEKDEARGTGTNGRPESAESLDKNSNQRAHTISSEKWFWPGISFGTILLFVIGWFQIARKSAKP